MQAGEELGQKLADTAVPLPPDSPGSAQSTGSALQVGEAESLPELVAGTK